MDKTFNTTQSLDVIKLLRMNTRRKKKVGLKVCAVCKQMTSRLNDLHSKQIKQNVKKMLIENTNITRKSRWACNDCLELYAVKVLPRKRMSLLCI